MTDDSIATKTERIEAIIDQLENDDVPLDRATELHAEAKALLEDLEAELDLGDGTVIEQ